MSEYTLYAHPVAQPSRAVIWLAGLLKFPHELKVTFPGKETNTQEFLDEVSPLGTIPTLVIKDKETGKKEFISDGLAIAIFICRQSGEAGQAFWPQCPLLQGKIVQMCLQSSVNCRKICTYDIFAPLVGAAVTKTAPNLTREKVDELLHPNFEGQIVDISRAAGWTKAKHDGSPDELVENPKSVFLVPNEGKPTIADFFMFAETYQLDMLGYADKINANRAAYKRWGDAMQKVPGFEEAHAPVKGFIESIAAIVPK